MRCMKEQGHMKAHEGVWRSIRAGGTYGGTYEDI